MKFKRLLSALAAAAVSVSVIGGVSVSADAATDSVSFADSSYSNETYSSGDTVYGGTLFTLTAADGGAKVSSGKLAYSTSKQVTLDGVGSTRPVAYITPTINGTVEIDYTGLASGKNAAIFTITGDENVTVTSEDTVSVNSNVTATLLQKQENAGTLTANLTANQRYLIASLGTGEGFASVKYTEETLEPTITLDQTTAKIIPTDTVTLTPTITNTNVTDVTWATSDSGVATVENGVVTGVAEGTTTITATITVDGTDYSATCAVTVTDKAEVTVKVEGAAYSVTLTNKDDSSDVHEYTTTTTEEFTAGTYTVTAVNGAPVTHSLTVAEEEMTFEIGGEYEVTTNTSSIVSSNTTDYSKMYGTTVTFSAEDGNPQSANYIALQYSSGYFDIETSVEDVYLRVDTVTNGGKFNSAARTDDVQINSGTLIQIPVVPGSKIEVVGTSFTYDGTTLDASNPYTYEGTEETTLEFTAVGGYLDSLTITSPATAIQTSTTGLVGATANGVTFGAPTSEGIIAVDGSEAPTVNDLASTEIVTVVYKATEAPTKITVDGTEVTASENGSNFGFNSTFGIAQFYGAGVSENSTIVLTFANGSEITATAA